MSDVQTALANEARRIAVKNRICELRGRMAATAELAALLSTMNNDSSIQLSQSENTLISIESDAGPGITADFGPKSIVTQLVESERAAAKSACIDFVKGNPECTEEEAAEAWDTAAIASHSELLAMPIQSGLAMGRLYRTNLRAKNLLLSDTWDAQRSWIIGTEKAIIMAL